MNPAILSEVYDSRPHQEVREAEYRRLLGYPPGHVPSRRARELAAWARDWYARHGRPWIYFRRADLRLTSDSLHLEGLEFRSRALQQHLRQHGAQRAMLVAVSAGAECEEHARELWNEGRPDEYFFLEIFGSAVVEDLLSRASGRICDQAGLEKWAAVPHYSPGYTGWDVAEQNKLFGLIARGMTSWFPGPLEVLSSGMLRPKKSLLAVFGLTPSRELAASAPSPTPCESCAFSPCQYRRALYRHAPAGAEVETSTAARLHASAEFPLTRNAKYSVNVRALQKWAGERVRIEYRADGALTAVFRFDGTTCSQMGRPLAFDYEVLLSGAERGYTVMETSCRPAEGDEGHQLMCSYLTDADGLMGAIASEKPLLGRRLDEILVRDHPSTPSACHCTAESRAHKWGLAFEAIHYALVHARVPQPSS